MSDPIPENKRRILESAMHLFASKGYDGVGVLELAESCSVTKPTLYHYFGNKRGIIEAALKDRFEPFLEGMVSRAEYRGDIVINLTDSAIYVLERTQADPDFFRFMLQSGFAPSESEVGAALKPWNDEYFKVFERLFSDASRNHGNMVGRQTQYAVSFIGTMHAWASLVLSRKAKPEQNEVHRIVHYFMHGIFS